MSPRNSAYSLSLLVFSFILFLYLKNQHSNKLILSAKQNNYKNILLILADDLGWSDIGYAKGDAITPNIDRLASQSIKLTNFYTYALCTPSRSSVMSGLFAEKLGLQHSVIEEPSPFGLPKEFTLMPQHFKNHGFKTYMVGKWHLGSCNMHYTPVNRGFDSFYGFFDALEDYYSHRVEYQVNNVNFSGLDFWNQTQDYLVPILDKNNTFSQFVYTEHAVNLIKSHDKSKPFFFYFAAQTPHSDHSFNCPKEYQDKYSNIKDEKRQKMLGLVSLLDDSIGNITKTLDEQNLLDETLIIFMSDNGGEIRDSGRNYPLRGGKRTVFEGGHRVRSFIHGKNLKPSEYDGMFHSVDLLPTLMSAALDIPIEFSGIDGVNQWDAISKNLTSRRKSFIYSIDPIGNLGCTNFTEAIRHEEWKLIKGCPGIYTDWYNLTEFDLTKYKSYNGVNISISFDNPSCVDAEKTPIYSYFLFNIKEDPNEQINRASDLPCKVRDLEIKLNAYKRSAVPPLITEPPYFDPKSNPANFGDKWSPGWC